MASCCCDVMLLAVASLLRTLRVCSAPYSEAFDGNREDYSLEEIINRLMVTKTQIGAQKKDTNRGTRTHCTQLE